MIDVNAFLGATPWRALPGTEPAALLATMDQLGISTAWVTHLPSLYWKDPAESHDGLYDVARRHPRLLALARPQVRDDLGAELVDREERGVEDDGGSGAEARDDVDGRLENPQPDRRVVPCLLKLAGLNLDPAALVGQPVAVDVHAFVIAALAGTGLVGRSRKRQFVATLQLPPAATAQIVTVQKDSTARMQSIVADKSLTADQRSAQFAALAQQATTALTTTLGESGLAAYKQSGGNWLTNLEQRARPRNR